MVLPPSLSGTPPMGSSPLAVPTGSPGAQAGAMSQARAAIDTLNKILPELPAGSEPWKAVNSALLALTKVFPPSGEVPGVQQTALRGLAADAGKNAMLQRVMSSLGAGGAQPGGGGQPPPPAQPQPGAM